MMAAGSPDILNRCRRAVALNLQKAGQEEIRRQAKLNRCHTPVWRDANCRGAGEL